MKNNQYLITQTKTVVALITLFALSGCVAVDDQYPKWSATERADVHIRLGMGYLQNGQYAIAEKEFDHALEIQPQADRAYHGKALLAVERQDSENTKRFFQRSIELNQNNFLVRNDYAIYLCDHGNIEQGVAQLREIVDDSANPQATITQLGLGLCYFQNNQYVEAEFFFQQVLQRQPNLTQALYPMAQIAFQRQDYSLSKEFIERYLQEQQTSAELLWLAFQVESELQNNDGAQFYRRLLLVQYPSSSYSRDLTN